MRIAKSLAAACLAALAVTAALAWIPDLLQKQAVARHPVAVFREMPLNRITNENVVDILSGVELRERLGKVKWSSSVLTVDIVASSQGGRPEALFSDMAKLIRLSYKRLTNVDRLLIRFTVRSGGEQRIMAAVDVRQQDGWLANESIPAYIDPIHDVKWRNRLRLSFTSAWVQRYGPVEGYSADSADDGP
ncbi:hypothetical protein M6D81_06510 [Paenibacillus sp. J5C_2022]|uniref:hypothetical protein n=1 Tax=Paenibacillus sp. J5C2022 TaxID=2977129 RepID=UPI0021CFED91|nr:hypothetical protein [Paenibacillus sp. J5C2022]MCU6708363.1 hypothetical protein [Paenibacillus sp. J5C2022]